MSEAHDALANTPSRNVLLTDRDLALLMDLHANVVMSFWQIHKNHFAGKNHSTVINRLKHLELAGLIGRTRVQRMRAWHSGKLLGVIYQIAPAGLKELSKFRAAEIFSEKIPTLNLASLEHDLLINDIRPELLRKFDGGHWINGRYLVAMKGLNKIPDAAIRMPMSGKLLAIELELHGKSSMRYKEIITQLRSSTVLEKVIYVTAHRSIDRKIVSEIEGYQVQDGHVLRNGFFEFMALDQILRGHSPAAIRDVTAE